MKWKKALGIPLFVLVMAFGAACSSGSSGECNPLCQAGEVCVNGSCFPQRCTADNDCPVGFRCISDFCRYEEGCRTDSECPSGYRCVEGGCYPLECQDGQNRICSTDCGTGNEQCVNGVWRGCDAPQPRDEVCGDDVDNDCDGDTDEGCVGCVDGQQRACQTECGPGQEWCVGGEFNGCTAPQPFTEVCGDELDNDCDGTTDEDCTGCTEGDTRTCLTVCGSGEERCDAGAWRGCDATRPHQEVCDGLDNDCDSLRDELLVRDCGTACGEGIETCSNGVWAGCTTTDNCTCGQDGEVDQQACGQCGVRERTCTTGRWGTWGSCLEQGDCTPGQIDDRTCGQCGLDTRMCLATCIFGPWDGCVGEGVCTPDQLDDEVCGECGETRTRHCEDDCTWGEFSECSETPAKECNPEAQESRPCERCGIEARTCNATCVWDDWGECLGMGDCEFGEEEADASACTTGYVRMRTCEAECTWGDWGNCELGGQCVPSETENDVCGDCGTHSRTCSADGTWGDWSTCVNEGECTPNDTDSQACGDCIVEGSCGTGPCVAGLQTRICLGTCVWGGWGTCQGNIDPTYDYCGDGIDQDCSGADESLPDQYEHNNTCQTASFLGEEPAMLELYATIDTADDHYDYFYFRGNDGLDPWEHIKIWIEEIPVGVNVDVCLYQGYTGCVSDSQPLMCSVNAGNTNEYIEWGDPAGPDDTGEFYIKVYRQTGNSCFEGYRMTVHGLR